MTFEEALEKNVTVSHESITEEEKQQILDDIAQFTAKIRMDKTA